MKLIGRRFMNCPIEQFPGSTVQQIGYKNSSAITNTFMSVAAPLSSFPGLYVLGKGFSRSVNFIQGYYCVLRVFYKHNGVT